MAVWTPGFVPTKMQIRFGVRMSVRGVRWAYLEGGAYLLGLRCFFLGGLDGWDVVVVVLRRRFWMREGGLVGGEGFVEGLEVPWNWYFASCPLKDVGTDGSGVSLESDGDSSLEATSASSRTSLSVERVLRILMILLCHLLNFHNNRIDDYLIIFCV